MPPKFNPIHASSALSRAKLALYGTLGLCTYTSWQTYVVNSTIQSAVQEQNQQRFQTGLTQRNKILDHYVCSRKNLKEGRYYTLITSVWNHGSGLHFLGNMLGLWSFGRVIAYGFGARTFMTIFYGGGIVGNLLCLGLDQRYGSEHEAAGRSTTKIRQNREAGFLGASGGVCAILAANACLNPWGSMVIGIMFIPVPVPNIVGALGFAGFSVWAQGNNFQTDVAHLGHLGGLFYGFLWFVAKHRFLSFL